MRVFIVRPFNVQDGFDFERLDAELIRPALERLRAEHEIEVFGGPTTEISRQGNIRADMFRLLVTSDLVIADVTMHNANAFYELGIRHALRDRHTVLMRAKTEHRYPFDLQTDRYFLYDRENLAEGIEGLARTLRETLASQEQDSPVFQLLPKLEPHPRGALTVVPLSFVEEVDRARNTREFGRLRLLAHEARNFEWHMEGLRLVGNAQLRLKAFPGATATFEAMRQSDPDDLQVNQRLGTVYQRLSRGESEPRKSEFLTLSDHRVRRALELATRAEDRAEAYALLGSNAKTRWIGAVRAAPIGEARKAALSSPCLADALDAYLDALRQRLDDHYPAINVLALLACQIELASALPGAWEAQHDDEQAASNDLQARKKAVQRIASMLELALGRDALIEKPADYNEEWALSSQAELVLLTRPNSTERVKQAYRRALANADYFTTEATRRNLEVFQYLKLFEPNTSAALEEIATLAPPSEPAPPERLVLFTGHMIDAATRPEDKPRFPRTANAERIAARLIAEALERESLNGKVSLGIAGGACGGDILFHEACEAAGIQSELMLALPPDQFLATSVQHGNADWVERYRRLCRRAPPRVMQESKTLPDWLAERSDYDIWQRNNLWMMFTALTFHAPHLTLIALYNPERDADGPGGTRHLLDEARRRAFKIVELDARELLKGVG
jgi:hypothetical protein